MNTYLILRLQGPMQSWGDHTFEDFRPSHPFPTRSGLTGLLGACLGIDRAETQAHAELSASFAMAVRSNQTMTKLEDFHTVFDVERVSGPPRKHPVVSRREYLCDASFSVAMRFYDNAVFRLEQVKSAIQAPYYTPTLGRRSCPLAVPLLEREHGGEVQAPDVLQAFALIPPQQGIVYFEPSEIPESLQLKPPQLALRDVPSPQGIRQFAKRTVCIYQSGEDRTSH